MPVNVNDVMQLLAELSKDGNLKVTITKSSNRVVGSTAAIGCLVGGVRGYFVGRLLGGIASYFAADDFKPVAEVIMEMDEEKKKMLYQAAMRVIENLDYTDLISLLRVVREDSRIYGELLSTIRIFFYTNLKMQVLN